MNKTRIDLNSKIPNLLRNMDAKLSEAVRMAALNIEAEAKTSILTGEKTGRVYGDHQASAPGEAPATDAGGLAGSIHADVAPGALQGIVAVGEDYAADLEFGTVHIQPRPFLTPAVEKTRKPFVRAVKRAIEEAAQ